MTLDQALIIVEALNAIDAQRAVQGQLTEAQLEAVYAVNAMLYEAGYEIKFRPDPATCQGWSYRIVGVEAIGLLDAA